MVFLLLGFAAAPPAAGGSGSLDTKIKEQKRRLEKIKKEMEEHRRQSRKLAREEKSLLKKLNSLEKEVALSERLLEESRAQEQLLEEKIDSLTVRISIEGEKLLYQKEKLGKRIRQMYMQEPNLKWATLLGSRSLQDVFRRHKFLKLVAKRDARLLREVDEHKRSLEVEQEQLTEALVDVAEIRKLREREKIELQKSRKRRLAMLRKIKSEKGKHEQALKDLEKAEKRLADLIGSMESKRLAEGKTPGAVDFASLKGRLIWPVKGKVVRKFGNSRHPTFGTVTYNSGIDIKASPGTPIRAVAGGTVEFVDWIAGYGRCIIVNHGAGYYTLYAHVSNVYVEPEQELSGGEVIAEVGDTGSIEGYVCHFEIRKSKKALNPLKWLVR
jgi:septal ring factor EnvC (AmiA/AmiB activator)